MRLAEALHNNGFEDVRHTEHIVLSSQDRD